jgi:hypothetical protein
MTEQTGSAKDVIHVCHEQRMVDRRGKLDVTVMSGTSEIVEMTRRTTARGQLLQSWGRE